MAIIDEEMHSPLWLIGMITEHLNSYHTHTTVDHYLSKKTRSNSNITGLCKNEHRFLEATD